MGESQGCEEKFVTEGLYAEFVYKTDEAGSMVRVRGACKGLKPRGSRSWDRSIELKEGDVGIVLSKEEGTFYGLGYQVTAKFGKLQLSLGCQNAEELAQL